MITIVGLGIRGVEQITAETEREIRAASEVLYLDTGVAIAAWLAERCPRATSLMPASYREERPRTDVYREIAAKVVDAALERGRVVFAVQGHPLVGVYAPFVVRALAEPLGIPVRVLPGIGSLELVFTALWLDPCATGLQCYEASEVLLRRRPLQNDVPLLLWQVGSVGSRLYTNQKSLPARFVALRDYLLRFYPPGHAVHAVFASPHPLIPDERITFPIGLLCEQAEQLHSGTTLVIPALATRPIADPGYAAQLDDAAWLRSVTVPRSA